MNGIFGSRDYISFPKMLGQVPILRSLQYVTFKYGVFKRLQKFHFVGPLYRLTLFKPNNSHTRGCQEIICPNQLL